jgi:proline dehydrogenase
MSLFDKVVASSLPLIPKPVVRRVAAPYIAGDKMEDELRVSAEFNRDGYLVAAAILGEFAYPRYRRAQRTIRAHGHGGLAHHGRHAGDLSPAA